MKQFFKFVFASALGFIFASILLGAIFIFTLIGLANSLGKEEKAEIKEKTILHFKPGMGIPERSRDDVVDFDFNTFEMKADQGLAEILATLKNASSDNRIEGIYLELPIAFSAGYSTLKEIHDALERFHDSGKFIAVHANVLTEWSYYLASTADEVRLSPSGSMLFNGMYADVWFYKEALEKLGVKVQVFKHGTFKSAVEPYILDRMSPENRQQVERYVNSLFDTYLNDVAGSRGMEVTKLREIADKMLVRSAAQAKSYGLVDEVSYEDGIFSWMKDKLGLEEDDDLHFMEMEDYAKNNPPKKHIGEERIAILYASGVIQEDGNGQDVVSAEQMVAAIRKIRDDKKIKALVLRINSPGGSALASDLIYRELELTREKMPVIVSMGDVAASGGYYIAALADTIVAQPNTITGSIGVFALIPDMQGLLNDKLGIRSDGVGTGEYSDLGRIDRPMTEGEKAIFQQLVEETYADFTSIVLKYRPIDPAAIDTIAEGRVWTGLDARDRGLVDLIGGVDLAIELAAGKAGLESYRLVAYPHLENPFSQFLNRSKKDMATELMREELGAEYEVFLQYRNVMRMKGIQMRMPFDVRIE